MNCKKYIENNANGGRTIYNKDKNHYSKPSFKLPRIINGGAVNF